MLLFPEGMVKLNASAGQILLRCDGTKSAATIVAELEQAFATAGLGADVEAFLQIRDRQGLGRVGRPMSANPGTSAAITPPLWLVAELTYTCPLHCPFCSNPLDFAAQNRRTVDGGLDSRAAERHVPWVPFSSAFRAASRSHARIWKCWSPRRTGSGTTRI